MRVLYLVLLVTLLAPTASLSVEDDTLRADDECLPDDDGACSLTALQRRVKRSALQVKVNQTTRVECTNLEASANDECRHTVKWVFSSGKWDKEAASWFSEMKEITGMDYKEAMIEDFQRLYYCSPPGGKSCGAPPCTCSKPPCGTCLSGEEVRPSRRGCSGFFGGIGIACKAPETAMEYKGKSWRTLTFHGLKEMHIFAIGDWGGMDGSLNPIEGRPHVVAYRWGARPGPSVFPRTRWNRGHTFELCTHKQFINCFNSHGKGWNCPITCGYVPGVDDQPQQLVANSFRERAALKSPEYILNVGDNFYWGGIEKTCGTPMKELSFTAHHQFNQIFESMYQGKGLSGKPWLSVLGNHDWGGRVFNNGWDQQIAYTWHSDRWVMPAPYFMVSVKYPTQLFSADIFMFDSNFIDAKEPNLDPEHNICGNKHNRADASCRVAGGPESIEQCPTFFAKLWAEQKTWLVEKISASRATWQIGVTHFPCGEDGEGQRFYKRLHKDGLDLLVTGHRHDQEMWLPRDIYKNHMGGLTCLVTGGGGGITSEATPNPLNKADWYGEGQYGFYDITISRRSIKIESINWDGKVLQTATVTPK